MIVEIVAPCEHIAIKTHYGIICKKCGKFLCNFLENLEYPLESACPP